MLEKWTRLGFDGTQHAVLEVAVGISIKTTSYAKSELD